MTQSPLAQAARLIEQAFALVNSAPDPLAALLVAEGISRRAERSKVTRIAAIDNEHSLASRGYRTTIAGLKDLLGWDHPTASRHVTVAKHVVPQTAADGTPAEPVLPATAAAFTAGVATMRHVEVVASLLNSAAGKRISAADRTAIETTLGEAAWTASPSEVRRVGRELLAAADVDGPGPKPGKNSLRVHANPDGTGSIHGEFDDPAAFSAIRTVLDARTRPSAENRGTTAAERNAAALVEVCWFALNHQNHGEVRGERPHLVVTISLEDLQNRARGAFLATGGDLTPGQLRRMACDAQIIPVVLGERSEAVDVGRSSRAVPIGMRRLVAARDGGCAHPGCDRPPSWCEVHHVIEWQHGGRTDLNNLVMLCCAHHDQVHDTEWTIDMSTGRPRFIPPAWLSELHGAAT